MNEERDSRRHRGEEVPHCGFRHWCRARKLFLALSVDELRLALESAPEPNLSRLIKSIGLQPNARRTPQLLRSRVAKMSDQPIHYLTWMLVATPFETVLEAVDIPEESEDPEASDFDLYAALRDGGLARWARRWPPGILRLALEGMWDRSLFGVEQRDELMALVDNLEPAAQNQPDEEAAPDIEVDDDAALDEVVVHAISSQTTGDAARGPVEGDPVDGDPVDDGPIDGGPVDGGPLDGGPLDVGPVDGGPLDVGPVDDGPIDGGPLDVGPLDVGPVDGGPLDDGPVDVGPIEVGPVDGQPIDVGPVDGVKARAGTHDEVDDPIEPFLRRAVAVALAPGVGKEELQRQIGGVEWLLDLNPESDRCWLVYGRLVGALGEDAYRPREPGSPTARRRFLAGQMESLADLRSSSHVVRLAAEHVDAVEQLLAAPPTVHLAAGIIGSHLVQPREAARLLALVREPFVGWPEVFRRARSEASTLLAAGAGSEAEILLRAVEERLLRWAAASGEADVAMRMEATATAVLRASCRRRRSDFVGAGRLLERVDPDDLDDAGRTSAALEAAMAAAEIAEIEPIRFPGDHEQRRMEERLQRAEPHLQAVVEADPAHLEANVLLGMLAFCRHDDAAAVRHLTMVADRMDDRAGGRPLSSAIAFHRAVARLRLLDPGTDEGAAHDMASAMDGGYRPAESELVAAVVALDAHGSPQTGSFLARAVDLAPASPDVVALVIERSGGGDPTARRLAEELATDDNRRLAERFELLEAALAGAEAAGDTDAAERLAGPLDEVVARANRPALDERWSRALEAGETLRSALEPAQADAMRMEVLRRAGRLDEARAIATGLFYRSAAGSLRAFDAPELLEVLRELGLPDGELEELGRLLPVELQAPRATGIGSALRVAGTRAPEDEPVTLGRVLAPTTVTSSGSIRILFVGGNETQEQYRPFVDAEMTRRYGGGVVVEWYFAGWSYNWMKVAESIEAGYRLRSPGAVVLMTLVRTNLGQWVRRTAGQHGLPWVACTGHGRAAIIRAIDRAVEVAAERAPTTRE